MTLYTCMTSNRDWIDCALADVALVGSMLGNLQCISRKEAAYILEAFEIRASDPSTNRLEGVPAGTIRDILNRLPPIGNDSPYRCPPDVISVCKAIAESATHDRVRRWREYEHLVEAEVLRQRNRSKTVWAKG